LRIITGMHRSGTSLVGRLFFEAGADMGNPDTFYRADRWNPEGYYEQPDIHAINMPLINGPWWKFSYFWLPSTQTIIKRARKMEDQIRDTALMYRGKVVKETRFCLTLPAWLEFGAQVEGIIICLRDPIAVARSIQKRNKTTLGHGYKLWRIHNERILEHSRGIPTWYIDYRRLLNAETFMEEMPPAMEFFGFQLGEDRLKVLCEQNVRPGMNHNREQVSEYPPKIRQLWSELKARHARQFS